MVGILLQMKRFKVDIFEAAFSGDVRLLKDMVITDCENINQTDAFHQTALHKAAMNGWLDCVVVLVENGVDVNSVDDCGCTALHYAAANGYLSVVKYLVQVGHADFRLKSNKGYEPQHMARRRGQVKLAAFLSEGALVNGW